MGMGSRGWGKSLAVCGACVVPCIKGWFVQILDEEDGAGGSTRWAGGLDYTAVSLAVKRFEQRHRHDKGLQYTITQVDTALRLK